MRESIEVMVKLIKNFNKPNPKKDEKSKKFNKPNPNVMMKDRSHLINTTQKKEGRWKFEEI